MNYLFMNKYEHCYVESDGDFSHSKDIYICQHGKGRIATIESYAGESQRELFKRARIMATSFELLNLARMLLALPHHDENINNMAKKLISKIDLK